MLGVPEAALGLVGRRRLLSLSAAHCPAHCAGV